MARLDGRVIIVTGGAQGIGHAYCERLAEDGANIVVVDIDNERAEATAAHLRAMDTEAIALGTDVRDTNETEAMARTTMERFGRIDGLVNNAAMFQRPAVSHVPFEKIPVDEWDRVMAVNLRGTFLCSRAVVPFMKEQRSGKIVNISSGTVFSGSPWFTHYVTSKAGVIGFTRALARELGSHGINVNAIAPGLTMSLEEGADEAHMEHQQERASARAFQRIETPQDLVGVVSFLCSSDSDFMTGQTLVVDGGLNMH